MRIDTNFFINAGAFLKSNLGGLGYLKGKI